MHNYLAIVIAIVATSMVGAKANPSASSPTVASAVLSKPRTPAASAGEKIRQEMEPKDYATITLSGLAFVLSLSATVITLRQKKYETERTLRSQLTDAIGKLNAQFEMMEKLREEKASSWNEPQVVNLKAFYNGQKLFYARQAIYVAKQIPSLVSDGEYNSIARAFVDTNDDAEAIQYYEKAIAAASDAFYKATNLRGYGRVLILVNRVKEGRESFQQSLSLVNSDTDSARWFRAETLQRWAHIEALRGDLSASEALFDRANAEYSAIVFPPRRRDGLLNLASVQKSLKPAPTPLAGTEESKGV